MRKILYVAFLVVVLSTGSAFASSRIPPLSVNPRFGNGGVGFEYSEIATASGDTAPYSWTFVSGELPPGLNFQGSLAQKTITLAGTPTTAGEYKFVMTLESANYERDFTFTVNIYQRNRWLDELERLNDNLEGNNGGNNGNSSKNSGVSGGSGGGCEMGVGIFALMIIGAGLIRKFR